MLLKAVMLGLAAALFAACAARAPTPQATTIIFEQLPDARARVRFQLPSPVKALRFNSVAGRYRARHWRFEDKGFAHGADGEYDTITRRDGEKFRSVTLIAKPHESRLEKDYQPIARYGEGGVLIYTGHFWPREAEGVRARAVFTFEAAPGGEVVAFGARGTKLENWRSPTGQGSFVYLGPLAPVETPNVMALVDSDAPRWIIEEFGALTPRIFARLADAFGTTLDIKPNLFLAAALGDEKGRLSYAGDATPGQFQITLRGLAWQERSEKGANIFRRSTAHEAAHLWQLAASPGEETPDWAHEGAAEAIAGETLAALGLWSAADYDADFEAARNACADRLAAGPLKGAAERKDYRAVYACGHVVAEAVSRAEGAPASSFWRAFLAEAEAAGDYSEARFHTLVRERTGDIAFARKLKRFIETRPPDAARAIDDLLDAASGR